jgi:IS30 family transposase
MKKAKKFTNDERSELQILHSKGYSARAIAKVMGRSPNTIAAELKRNSYVSGEYVATYAKQRAHTRRKYAKYQGKKIEEHTALRSYVVTGLQSGWNPDEISGAMRRTNQPFYASKTAIYEWLYSAYGQPYCQYLSSCQYRPKQRRPRIAEKTLIPNRVSAELRPQGATNRTRYGHWEGDTVVSGKKTGSKAALAVFTERRTRLVTAALIPNLKPESFAGAAIDHLVGKKALSLTLDNGIENRLHAAITQKTGAAAYFCAPYSSWQKGQVEHTNKLLRAYFPKGCDLGQFDQTVVAAACARLNNKPRKILGYKSALQLAKEKGVIHRVVS